MTDALEPLRQRFLVRARADLAAIEAHLAGEALSFEALRLLAHRLAGAGGTFGYLDISRAAGEAEDRLLAGGEVQAALLDLREMLSAYTAPA